MSKKSWSSIRVQQSTLSRIKRYRMELIELYIQQRIQLPDDQCEGVTVDYALNRLLDTVEAHRARAAKARAKKPPRSQEG